MELLNEKRWLSLKYSLLTNTNHSNHSNRYKGRGGDEQDPRRGRAWK